ncbi:MAG: DUF2961 domain-containing protein [Planctomycetota bacterium]
MRDFAALRDCVALILAFGICPASLAQSIAAWNLTEVPGLASVHQFSSHNKEGLNGDDVWHLYDDEKGHAVIFDAEGPGCVRSIWSTDIREDAVFHWYFDGEKEARFSIPMLAFFKGEHPLFPAPLVSYERRGYWGDQPFAGNCFVPVPFAKGLKITVSGELHFYRVMWESFPHGTIVETFTGEEDHGFVTQAFASENPGAGIIAGRGFEGLAAGEELVLYESGEGGVLREIQLDVKLTDEILRETWIRMVWDGHDRYDVNAPLGYFFGSAVKITPMASLPLSVRPWEDGRVLLSCRFPMAFSSSARIVLANRSDTGLGPFEFRFYESPKETPPPPDRIAYFTTTFREGWTTYGRDWLLAETPGAGWYVGTVQTMLGEHYCEGDEHFALDGAISPQINGTGTEDYYLGCFWPNRGFNSPFACVVGDIQAEGGSMAAAYGIRACYARYHLEAPLPFLSHLDARIQHGGYNTIRSSYGSLAFHYLRGRPALVETDFLDVASPASEASHRYQASTGKLTGPVIARPEGRNHLLEERESGRRHETGTISFTLAVDPANQGVRIRRRLDQGSPRQTAEVLIDGEPVGIWYHADQNQTLRWFDSDFDLHPRFTAGKSSLEVELRVRTGEGRGAFTDFSYRAFSLTG